ncbi:hypothetical protein QVN84_09770 [Prevotella lascolaii]|uniref:Uncharacterized protein n=1 Tax=Leyella lascolaii TaxID=1776379 RepID=A0AAW7JVG5_9BACT|nr:hypothetical protein [Leyella lascolaii]MDN0025801.1 hypothetical protein [Leyella lascolaii]
MAKIVLDDNYIKSLPITTNRIEVSWDKDKFFEKYSIVSYYSTDPERKNLAYEQLGDVPFISVTGIKDRWENQHFPSVLFFILTVKGKEQEVLNSLRTYNDVKAWTNTLEKYEDKVQQRIIASLAINSLGKKKNSNMMYNDGSLLVCDDKNFGARKSRKELVCLKIEVNEYMILTARTTSFSNPYNEKDLLKHRTCTFQVAKDFDGDYWSGQAVKPIIIKSVKSGEYDLKKLFIQKKNFKDNKNLVPYWPYNVDDYSHGKLYVIWQVVESVNEAFKGTVEVNFRDSLVIHYDECKTKDGILNLIQEYLAGRSISFEDPFQTSGSKSVITNFKNEAQEIMSGHLVFSKRPTPNDIIIKLCEPKEENSEATLYSQSMVRMLNNGNALQHITYYGDKKLDLLDTSSVRRILIELIVKDSLAKRVMPKPLVDMLDGWNAIRYKINQGNVHGASMKISNQGTIEIEQYGLSQDNQGEDFENFIFQNLKYSDYDKIRGARDYMALVKDGNVYFIVDTDEIPILDVNLIDEAYNQVANKDETVAMFKRKKVAHDYLRGYIGFHLWKTEGIDGEPNSSYSYISGTNSESMKITPKTKMDKMPRARRIFILHKENAELIEQHIFEICEMLKFGFGRWNELMTYPFPFKFLQEYLDDAAETAYSLHWKDITYKKDL